MYVTNMAYNVFYVFTVLHDCIGTNTCLYLRCSREYSLCIHDYGSPNVEKGSIKDNICTHNILTIPLIKKVDKQELGISILKKYQSKRLYYNIE